MNSDQQYTEQISHRSMPRLDPQVAPVMPGPEIAKAAVSEMGESPVPDVSSDTNPEPAVDVKSAAELVRLLRSAGLSKAAARAVASAGWRGLKALGSGAPQDEIGDLITALNAVKAKLEED